MTYVPWLITLPQCPLPYENQISLGENYVEVPVDVGPPMRRQRTTVTYDQAMMVFLMTRQQIRDFRDYFSVDLRGGSYPFRLLDREAGKIGEYLILGKPEISRQAHDRYHVALTTQMRFV
jgi:hypothetical protein